MSSGATTSFAMIRTLSGVGLFCGLAIVTVFTVTEPIIAANQAEARERAILKVVPGAATSAAFVAAGDSFTAAASEDRELLFAAYDDSGKLSGVAIETQGQGYQDVIRVLYGYSFEEQAIVGMAVLETRETPGLGDKIEQAPYTENFVRLDVRLDASGERLAHSIEAVKPGEKENPWQIDTVTGATISSKAVADMVAKSAAEWIPRIARSQQAFERERRAQEGDADSI